MKLLVTADNVGHVVDVPCADYKQACASLMTLLQTKSKPSPYFTSDEDPMIPDALWDAPLHAIEFAEFKEEPKKPDVFHTGYASRRILRCENTKTKTVAFMPSYSGNIDQDRKVLDSMVSVWGERSKNSLGDLGMPKRLIADFVKAAPYYDFTFVPDSDWTSPTTNKNIRERVDLLNQKAGNAIACDMSDYCSKYSFI